LRYVSVDLETEVVAEKVADPTTGTELVVELETAVIPCVAGEPADLDLAATLRVEDPIPPASSPRTVSTRMGGLLG
jgi:hypothetical protein